MSTITLDRTALDLVLDEINQLRENLGLGPALDAIPCGKKARADQCPLAQALGQRAWVSTRHFWIFDDWNDPDDPGNDLPPALQEFVDDFDNGAYPELEI